MSYIISSVIFFKVKPYLNGSVFWRQVNQSEVEVKPITSFSRDILDKINENK